jgi:Na+/H+-dicarboxylate symporter
MKNYTKFIGLAFLFVSLIMFIGVLLGIADISSYEVLGHSGIRSIAGLAVSGCLIAAIGFHDF